jgi:hypothetical protein
MTVLKENDKSAKLITWDRYPPLSQNSSPAKVLIFAFQTENSNG